MNQATSNVAAALHPDAVVYLVRHGHAAPGKDATPEGDFNRALSEVGEAQADRLREFLDEKGIEVDYVICSCAPRAQNTGKRAIGHRDIANWYDGTGRQLWSTTDDAGHAAIFASIPLVKTLVYADYRGHSDEVRAAFDQFEAEARDTILGLPGIGDAKNIIVFNHGVMGNAVLAGLFRQHRAELEKIALDPCDMIKVTSTSIEHISLAKHKPPKAA